MNAVDAFLFKNCVISKKILNISVIYAGMKKCIYIRKFIKIYYSIMQIKLTYGIWQLHSIFDDKNLSI